jgi:hypothetical protein
MKKFLSRSREAAKGLIKNNQPAGVYPTRGIFKKYSSHGGAKAPSFKVLELRVLSAFVVRIHFCSSDAAQRNPGK